MYSKSRKNTKNQFVIWLLLAMLFVIPTREVKATSDGTADDITYSDSELSIPLTFELDEGIEKGTITISSPYELYMKYSVNNGEKKSITSKYLESNIYRISIPLNAGETVQLYGLNQCYNNTSISCTVDYMVYGNIMSLIDEVDYESNNTLETNSTFRGLFKNNRKLKSHPTHKLILPATKLAEYCYSEMFSGCTSLSEAPELPATTLKKSCYQGMFSGCTSLSEAPILPAKALGYNCYQSMFSGCTSLSEAPELLATTLVDYCYSEMFSGCTNLSKAPELPARTLYGYCYQGMFSGCTNLSEAPKLPATSVGSSCYKSMFSGCINLTEAPKLPAKVLGYNCYQLMFSGCTSLIEAPELPATTLANSCYSSMFKNCTNLSKAPSLPATTLKDYCYSSMFSGCTNLTEAPVLPATGMAGNCYSYMFSGCTNLTEAPSLLAKTLVICCYQGMFLGCTNLTEAPRLPATTLDDYCYSSMFKNCTNLSKAPSLPATILKDYCYSGMFLGCTNLTEAPKLPAGILARACYSEMFSGCTSLSKAPELPVTTLKRYCYSGMFSDCINLSEAPELPAEWDLEVACYKSMFSGCTNLTEAPRLPSKMLVESCYSSMFSGCTNLSKAPELPATTLAKSCYSSMFSGCTNLSEAPKLPAKKLAESCYSEMFSGCTNLKKITITGSNVDSSNSFKDWLKNTSTTGVIFVRKPSALPIDSYSGIPQGWTQLFIQDIKAPEAIDNLIYNGEAQTLVTEVEIINADGNTSNDSIKYSLDNANWSTDVPKATEIGKYTVYYKVDGNEEYAEHIGNPITVTIYGDLEKIYITSQPISSEVDINEQAFFDIEVIGNGLTYLWQFKRKGDEIWCDWANMTSSEISIEYSLENNGLLLRCVITNSFGEKLISNEAMLTYRHAHQYEEIPYKAATCIEAGNEAYYICKFTECDLLFSDINGSTISGIPTIPVDCDNHLWDEPSYTWSEDNSKVTAIRICNNDESHIDSETVDTVKTIKTKSDGTKYEEYIALFTNEAFETQTIVKETVPIGIVIKKHPQSVSVEEGKIAYFDIEATGEGLKYLWQYKYVDSDIWVDWTSKNTASINVAYADYRNRMSLRCVVADSSGKILTSNEAILSYENEEKLAITSHPVSISVESEKLAYFEVKATGKGLKYLWQYKNAGDSNWTDWTSKITASISVAYAAYRDGMSIRCVITDSTGKKLTSNGATLTYKKSLTIIKQPLNTSVNENELAYFAVTANGNDLNYLWQYKEKGKSTWTNWTTKTTATISVAYATSRNGMSLRCVITDSDGNKVTSNEVVLTYKEVSNLTITAHPENITVNEKEIAYFTVTASGSGLKYLWQYKNKGDSSWTDWTTKTTATISVAYAAYRNGMSIRCVISDNTGNMMTSNAVTLTYKTNITLTITKQPSNATVKTGELAYFDVAVTGEGLRYLWQYKEKGKSTWTDWNTKTIADISVAYLASRNDMSLRCVVTDKNGYMVISNEAVLTYSNSTGPVITTQPKNTTVGKNELAYFSVKATGDGLKYLWQYKNKGESTWTDWTTKTTDDINVAYAAYRNGMSLRCVVTDKNDNIVTSNVATLTYGN